MTSLEDVASSGVDVILASELLESWYRLETTDVTEADDLSPEGEFPQYGRFLQVPEFSNIDGAERGETHIEVPRNLAQWLVENADLGDLFEVMTCEKRDGEWFFDVELVGTEDQTSLEAAAAMDGSSGN